LRNICSLMILGYIAMQVARDTVVSFQFTLQDLRSGDTLETSAGDARAYLHGHGGLLPALEKALEGAVAGEARSIELAPEHAYGPHVADRVQRVPVKHLQFAGKLRNGAVVGLRTADGRTMPVTVVKVGKFAADVDVNHPCAGRHLRFDIVIDEVRAAQPEELAHGHAHGPGGHHH
jgi:FKBP-type peptidyl-prolyl cis-trans isomerase SlyD